MHKLYIGFCGCHHSFIAHFILSLSWHIVCKMIKGFFIVMYVNEREGRIRRQKLRNIFQYKDLIINMARYAAYESR